MNKASHLVFLEALTKVSEVWIDLSDVFQCRCRVYLFLLFMNSAHYNYSATPTAIVNIPMKIVIDFFYYLLVYSARRNCSVAQNFPPEGHEINGRFFLVPSN